MTTTVHGLAGLKAIEGKDLGVSDWLEITQERVNLFAEATGDHQWIHVDVDRAATGPFGAPVAHGYLSLSLVVPLLAEVLDVQGVAMGVNYGVDKLRFPSPVPVGSRVRLQASLDAVEDVAGNGVQATLGLTLEVEGASKPACVAVAVYRYYA